MKPVIASMLLLPVAALAADNNAMPDLAPAYGELPPTFWELHHTAIIVTAFVSLGFAILCLRLLLRPKKPPVLLPEMVARQARETLSRLQDRPATGKLLSEVSQILRLYICATFGLPFVEMTTAEFCITIAANEKIGPGLAQTISNFLCECDEHKFSPTGAAVPFNAVTRALELISLAEKRLRTAPVPAAATLLSPPVPAKQPPPFVPAAPPVDHRAP